jgi:hypothetical protein
MSHSLGIAIESLVAILLMLTIGYCMLLNKRLQRLKADEHSLKATIGELITATEIAERAIGGLKHTVRDVNENLGSQLTAATQSRRSRRRPRRLSPPSPPASWSIPSRRRRYHPPSARSWNGCRRAGRNWSSARERSRSARAC